MYIIVNSCTDFGYTLNKDAKLPGLLTIVGPGMSSSVDFEFALNKNTKLFWITANL